MKYLLLIFLFLYSDLFAALKKNFVVENTTQNYTVKYFGYGYDNTTYQQCQDGLTVFGDPYTTNPYTTSGSQCTDNAVANGIDLDKLIFLNYDITTSYDPTTSCEQFWYNNAAQNSGSPSWKTIFAETKSYSCNYECSASSKSATHSDTAVFNEDLCEWFEPCQMPEDSAVEIFSDKATTAMDQCQAFKSNLEDNNNINGNLYCYGCPGAQDVTLFQKDIAACPSGTTSTSVSNAFVCVEPACEPLSDHSILIRPDLCSGLVTDWNNGVSGRASFQHCDSTCYILEPMPIPCSSYTKDVISMFKKSCDEDLNNFKFSCTDSKTGGSPTINKSCTPINADATQMPCTKARNDNYEKCNSLNKDTTGDCTDNGITIITNTLDCKDIKPDCSSSFGEVYNAQTNQCDCKSGFYKDSFDNCSPDIFGDTNDTKELQEKKKIEDDNAKAKDKAKTDKETKNELAKGSDKLDTTNNILTGIRSDLNTTNNLLNKILDNKDTNNSSDYSEDEGQAKDRKAIDGILSDAYDTLSDIKGDYESLYKTIENGFTVSNASSGTAPVFSVHAFKTVLSFDLCSTFSIFYPIFYFMFTVLMMLASLKIYFKAFRT